LGQKKPTDGPVSGPSIDDLFSHSYIPRIRNPQPRARASKWFWVAAARVWDSTAERFPASLSDIRQFGAHAKCLQRVQSAITDERSFAEVAKSIMERKPFQGRDGRDGDRYQGRREDYQDQRREVRESFQGPDGHGRRDPQDRNDRDQRPNRQGFRDLDPRNYQGRKRAVEMQEERDVKRMTEEDLRHKIEDRRRNFNQLQNWGSISGQYSGQQMKCFNCNDYGHHQSTCTRPPFCYSCRDIGHKSA